MDHQFSIYNAHLEDADRFEELDPHLRELKRQKYVYVSPQLQLFPSETPGIYTLSGGRQIGKTTLLKQWMLHLMQQGIDPISIFFFTGELIDDHHAMLRLMQRQLENMPKDSVGFFIIDEVTYIKNWERAIKFAADARLLENIIVMLSGSDLSLLQEIRMTFPGRRGRAIKKDFHIYPLSFREFLELTKPIKSLDKYLDAPEKLTDKNLTDLFSAFKSYLYHGGFLTAINNMAVDDAIHSSILEIYSDWIRGDVLKRGKNERYLQEILNAIIKRYGSQITWSSLAADLSIDHPNTVADYCHLLETMDVLFTQQAILEDKLLPAPKKSKKIVFNDPFIYHAIRAWLSNEADDPFHQHIVPAIEDPVIGSHLVEACVVTHFRRYYPTYYIKAEGEVDIAYVKNNKFWPVEIKWGNQLRPKDLKQISKYKNGLIYAKTKTPGHLNHIKIEPLPLALLKIGE